MKGFRIKGTSLVFIIQKTSTSWKEWGRENRIEWEWAIIYDTDEKRVYGIVKPPIYTYSDNGEWDDFIFKTKSGNWYCSDGYFCNKPEKYPETTKLFSFQPPEDLSITEVGEVVLEEESWIDLGWQKEVMHIKVESGKGFYKFRIFTEYRDGDGADAPSTNEFKVRR